MIFFSFFLKDTLSVSFSFAGIFQQCLVTGSKWNILVTDAEPKSTHFDLILCSLCVNLHVELSQHYASIKKVLWM